MLMDHPVAKMFDVYDVGFQMQVPGGGGGEAGGREGAGPAGQI